MTNLGPLPTGFAIASSCVDEMTDVYKVITSTDFFLNQGPLEATTCFPSAYVPTTEAYYSPGFCPTGFTSACSSLNLAGTVTETVVNCCPTNAQYICQTDFTDFDWYLTLGCTVFVDHATTTVWTVSLVTDGETSLITSTGPVGGLNAYSLQVRHQSSDYVSTTPASTTPPTALSSSTSTSTTDSGLPQNTNTPDSLNNGGPQPSGLSTGATAGIAVGATVVVIGLLALIAGLFVRKRKARRRQQKNNLTMMNNNNHYSGGGSLPPPPPLNGTPPHQHQLQQPQQYYDSLKGPQNPGVYEMQTNEHAAELPSHS